MLFGFSDLAKVIDAGGGTGDCASADEIRHDEVNRQRDKREDGKPFPCWGVIMLGAFSTHLHS